MLEWPTGPTDGLLTTLATCSCVIGYYKRVAGRGYLIMIIVPFSRDTSDEPMNQEPRSFL